MRSRREFGRRGRPLTQYDSYFVYSGTWDGALELTRDACATEESAVEQPSQWTFLTNHAHVLICIARDPSVRLRDVADAVGITERAAQRIVQELEAEGYLEHERVGRRNYYRLNPQLPLRHPLEREHRVAELLASIGATTTASQLRSD